MSEQFGGRFGWQDHDSLLEAMSDEQATPADTSTSAVCTGAGVDLPRHPGATLHAGDSAATHQGQPGAEPKFASHQDEYDALIGQTQDDLDYVERVQRIYFESEGGKHAARMLGALLAIRGEFVPRRDLELLLGEYRHIVAGGRVSSRAAPHANPCDCPPEHPFIRDGRCIEGIGCSDAPPAPVVHEVQEPGHWNTFQGRWVRNRCTCGFRGWFGGEPSENALEGHFREVGAE